MDTRCTINRGSHARIPLPPNEQLALDIANGTVPYQITPCPETGGRHHPHISSTLDIPWVQVECEVCGWSALALIGDDYLDEEDFTIYMVETAIPDDGYQQAGKPIHLWQEMVHDIPPGAQQGSFAGIGLDVVGYRYHTHDRMPVLDPKNPGQVIWPIV
jgi:hypothetical protein